MSEQSIIEDFLTGQRDCSVGVEHKPGMGEDYDRGYGAQYELEQIKSEQGGLQYVS